MVAEVEIDAEGRIKLPDEFRAAFDLVPGRRLTLDSEGDCIVIHSRPPGVYEERGLLVYDHGRPLPSLVDWIDEAREARLRQLTESWHLE